MHILVVEPDFKEIRFLPLSIFNHRHKKFELGRILRTTVSHDSRTCLSHIKPRGSTRSCSVTCTHGSVTNLRKHRNRTDSIMLHTI